MYSFVGPAVTKALIFLFFSLAVRKFWISLNISIGSDILGLWRARKAETLPPNGVSLSIFRHKQGPPFQRSKVAQLWSYGRKVEANRAKVGVTSGLSLHETPFVAFLLLESLYESPLPLLLCMHSSCYPTQMVRYYWETSYMLIKWIMQR